MKRNETDKLFENLPACAADFIKIVIKKMRYHKKVRREVMAELAAHFEDELRDCKTSDEKEQKAQQLIEKFGDAKLLGVLLRRGKKRCRPLWLKTISHACNIIFMVYISIIVLAFIYNAWAVYTWSTNDIDYVKIINQLNRPKRTHADNAWEYYKRAIESYVEIPKEFEEKLKCDFCTVKFDNLSKVDETKLEQWLQQNEASWQYIVKATTLRYYWRNVSGLSPYDNEENSKHNKQMKKLAKLGIWIAEKEVSREDYKKAMNTLLTVMKIGKHLLSSKITLEYLVGTDINCWGESAILRIVANYPVDRDCLAITLRELEEMYINGYPMLDKQDQEIEMLGCMQSSIKNNWKIYEQLNPSLLLYRWSRPSTEKRARQFFEKVDYQSPFERNKDQQITNEEITLFYNPMSDFWRPSWNTLIELCYKQKTRFRAVVTILALERWKIVKGIYPENLNDLVSAEYLKELPMDPYSDKPLVYKKTADGFLLYSISHNFIDDGGVLAKNKKGETKLWANEGDAVFWPVMGK